MILIRGLAEQMMSENGSRNREKRFAEQVNAEVISQVGCGNSIFQLLNRIRSLGIIRRHRYKKHVEDRRPVASSSSSLALTANPRISLHSTGSERISGTPEMTKETTGIDQRPSPLQKGFSHSKQFLNVSTEGNMAAPKTCSDHIPKENRGNITANQNLSHMTNKAFQQTPPTDPNARPHLRSNKASPIFAAESNSADCAGITGSEMSTGFASPGKKVQKSTKLLREIPRHSLDSGSDQFQKNQKYKDSPAKTSSQHPAAARKSSPSVVARLMGLTDFPESKEEPALRKCMSESKSDTKSLLVRFREEDKDCATSPVQYVLPKLQNSNKNRAALVRDSDKSIQGSFCFFLDRKEYILQRKGDEVLPCKATKDADSEKTDSQNQRLGIRSSDANIVRTNQTNTSTANGFDSKSPNKNINSSETCAKTSLVIQQAVNNRSKEAPNLSTVGTDEECTCQRKLKELQNLATDALKGHPAQTYCQGSGDAMTEWRVGNLEKPSRNNDIAEKRKHTNAVPASSSLILASEAKSSILENTQGNQDACAAQTGHSDGLEATATETTDCHSRAADSMPQPQETFHHNETEALSQPSEESDSGGNDSEPLLTPLELLEKPKRSSPTSVLSQCLSDSESPYSTGKNWFNVPENGKVQGEIIGGLEATSPKPDEMEKQQHNDENLREESNSSPSTMFMTSKGLVCNIFEDTKDLSCRRYTIDSSETDTNLIEEAGNEKNPDKSFGSVHRTLNFASNQFQQHGSEDDATNNRAIRHPENKEENPLYCYVKDILQLSGLLELEEDFLHSSVFPLDSMLFDTLELNHANPRDGLEPTLQNSTEKTQRMLIFDTVNDILHRLLSHYMEKERLASSSYRFHGIRPKGKGLLEMVWKELQHLQTVADSELLILDRVEKVVKMDHVREKPPWCNAAEQLDSVASEIEVMLLDGLIFEAIFDIGNIDVERVSSN